MPAHKQRSFIRKASCFFITLATSLAAIPVANDDAFEVDEDGTLIISSGGSILSANFEGGNSVLSPTWEYLDRIENENGINQSYPLDGTGLTWNTSQFDSSTSTIGPWAMGNAPFQGGTIDGFPPGTPSVLAGLAAAGNGENLVTTYLFRQQFSLSAAEAVEGSWILEHLIDDGGIVYINGTEVFRTATMPAGAVTANTFSQNADETNFGSATLNLSGIVQEGSNTIAVEVHQTTLTSSDVGLSLNLAPISNSPLAGFTYTDDTFNGTSRPNNANGELDPTGGFSGGALFVQVGRRLTTNPSTSGGWQRTFSLDNPATATISFRYRLTFSDDYETDEYGEALFEVDGVRYGNDIENSLTRFRGDGNGGGGLDDSGWQEASFEIPLSIGNHSIVLGAFSSKSTSSGELTSTWFDDIEISVPENGGGVLLNDSGGDLEAIIQTSPQHGSLNLNSDGSFTYQPALHFYGMDTFTYLARDPSGDSPAATVTLTVNPVNDPPVAIPENYSGIENSTLGQFAPGLLGNDTDLENDSLSAVLVNNVTQGTLNLNPNGSFSYDPNPGYFGTDSFTYRASDGNAVSDPVLVTLEIAPINDPPIAINDNYETLENIPIEIVTTQGGNQIVFESNFNAPTHSPQITGPGVIESVQGFEGRGNDGNTFSDRFLRNQAGGNPSEATTLTLENLPPHQTLGLDFLLAIIDSWDGDERFTVTVDGVEVFGETFRNVGSGGSFGYPAGSLIFRDQDAGFNGTQSHLEAGYDLGRVPTLRNIPHNSSSATISWFVTGDGWEAGTDESWAIDNIEVTVTAAPDEVLIPAGASWSFLDNGTDLGTSWRNPDFNDSAWATGPAELGYGEGDEETTVSFGDNSNNKHITTYFRHNFTVTDASDFDELFVGYIRDDGCAIYLNGTLVALDNLDPDASAETPALLNPGRTAEGIWNEVKIPATLLTEGTNILAIEIHQDDENSSDISMNAYLVGKRALVAGITANDTDPENDRLVAQLLTGPQNGTLDFNSDGTFLYLPAVNYEGTDSFIYRVTDGEFFSPPATVNLNMLSGPNDFPVTTSDTYSAVEDTPLSTPTASGILRNDSDPEGSNLSAIIEGLPSNGTVSLAVDGSFTYTPSLNFFGSDSFTYRANDGTDSSRPETVTLNIAPRNDPPVGLTENYLTAPVTPLTVTARDGVLQNDSDPDNATLKAIIVSSTSSGTLNLAQDGSFTYSPNFGFAGTDTFTYQASDDLLRSNPIVVSIVVNAPPVAVDNSYQIIEDSPMIRLGDEGILANDLDSDSLTVILISEPSNGTLTLGIDGGFIYIPDANFNGTDSFAYLASDGLQESNLATVNIDIESVDDPPQTQGDQYETQISEELAIDTNEGVLSNDSDVEGRSLTATLSRNVTNGTLNLASNGSFTYQPTPDFVGTDSFSYIANDGALDSGEVEVEIEVSPSAKNIVINEIMFNPTSGNDLEEFIELANTGSLPISINGWQLNSGVNFTFPDITIPPGDFLVISADTTTFAATYGAIPNVLGNWTGKLSNSSERIRLIDDNGEEVDEVRYYDQGDWARRARVSVGNEPGWVWISPADGRGSSLELINPALSNKQGQNWGFSTANLTTPGAANSAAADNSAPLILDLEHRPAIPTSSDPIGIVAELRDESGETIDGTLYYRVSAQNPGVFQTMPMLDNGANYDDEAGDGIYGAMLPPQPNGTVIEFYVESSDGANTRTWPAPADNGQTANALLQVDDEANTFDHAFYRVIMPVSEFNQWRGIRRESNAQMNTTVILNDGSGPDIRYSAGMRVRGAGSRNHTPVPMRISIPRDNDWNDLTKMNLNTKFTYLQFLGMKLFEASGMQAPDTYRVQVRINGTNIAREDGFDYGSMVHVQPLSSEFIDDKFKTDDGGNLYKKVRPDREFRWRDGVINDYESDGWSKQTNSSEDDWSDLDEMLRVINNSSGDADYIDQMEAVADLDQWMKWFGAMAILANGETNVSNGADDDFSMYRGAVDPRFVFLPHDLDTILSIGDGSRNEDPEHTLFDMIEDGDVLNPFIPLFNNPVIIERYFVAIRELLQTTFSKQEFDELLDNNLTDWVPQAQVEQIRNFMDARRIFIEREITAVIGAPNSLPLATSNETLESPHGSLYLSEILAVNNSTLDIDGSFPDIIEIHNTNALPANVGGMSLSDDPSDPARFVFPANTLVPANGFLLIYGDLTTGGGELFAGFNLNSGGESLSLFDTAANGNTVLDTVSFGLQIPDHSISRIDGVWQLSPPTLGMPNQSIELGDPTGIQVNEWLSQDDSVFEDEFIELFNPSNQPVALGGLAMSDEPVIFPRKHILPDLSFIAPTGFTILTPFGNSADPSRADELPFKLASENEWISLLGTNDVMIDQVHFVNQRSDLSRGRTPDGSSNYEEFVVPTPGYTNNTPLANERLLIENLRISEIMYNPLAGSDFEFIELQNIGQEAINLNGVRFTEGIRFTFPELTLQPGEFVVLVNDRSSFEALYGDAVPVAGQYDGKLSNGGERLRLEVTSINAGIHDFEYDDWYPASDGSGFSLEFNDTSLPIDAWNLKPNWAPGLAINGTPGNSGTFFVNTSPQETVTLPDSLTIDPFVSYGSVSPASVIFQWELTDGPAPVFFTTPGEASTEIHFDLPGTYNIRLNATAFDFDQSQEVELTVHDSYPAWVERTFGNPTPGQTDKENDPDGDGISNLFEFALGLDPSTQDAESFPVPAYDPISKRLSVTWTNRQLDPRKFAIIAEVSDDLKTWRSGPSSLQIETLSSTGLTETFRAVDLISAEQARTHFMRLRVVCFDEIVVDTPPEIISLTNLTAEPLISFTSHPGQRYQLEALSAPQAGWFKVGSAIIATSETSTLADQSQRDERFHFYRIRRLNDE
ncbi:MAG: Ig-like domain-containing protein [Akkermansiaceae bacterium]